MQPDEDPQDPAEDQSSKDKQHAPKPHHSNVHRAQKSKGPHEPREGGKRVKQLFKGSS